MTLFKLWPQSKNKFEKIKALRDDVAWLDGFNLGFSKAWDMMIPLMSNGIDRTKDFIRNSAIEETINGLEETIKKRIEDSGKLNLISANEVLAKRREFELKASASNEDEKLKYKHYIETLNWVINGNLFPKTK